MVSHRPRNADPLRQVVLVLHAFLLVSLALLQGRSDCVLFLIFLVYFALNESAGLGIRLGSFTMGTMEVTTSSFFVPPQW